MNYFSKAILVILILMVSCAEKNKEKKEASTVVEKEEQVFTLEELKQQRENWKIRTKEAMESQFAIEILDDEALNIIDPDSKIAVLASGFRWSEGPLWIEEGKFLLFSDIPNNKVYKLDENLDTLTYLQPSGLSKGEFTGAEPGSNGLLMNNDGALVLMQHGNRAIGKMKASINSPKPDYDFLINKYQGKRLNSPNDGAFDKEGNLYFTDPPYGLPKGLEDPGKELDFQGVYCLLTSGELILLDKTLKYPNGICISPDGKKLYVAVSNIEKPAYYEYDIVSPGKVANKSVFHNVDYMQRQEGYGGLPDGLKMTESGYILATGPKGVLVFNRTGKLLARVHTGQLTANCALGPDEGNLFMTAHNYILSLKLKKGI